MKQVTTIIENDPLKIKSHENQYVTPKVMYLLLVGAIISFGLVVLFYFYMAIFGGGGISDRNYIEGLAIDMKIMPSYNTYKNMADMKFSQDSSITSEVTDDLDRSHIDAGDWFFYNNTTPNYFPTLYFDGDHVPVGDS
jgi:hypothetical protein